MGLKWTIVVWGCRSEEIAVLHAHIEAFLHHCIFEIDVRAGPYSLIGAVLVDVCAQSLELKSLFLWIKDCQIVLQSFRTRLLERAWPSLSGSSHFVLRLGTGLQLHIDSMLVLSRAWHVKLEALSVEYLVVVESRRCFVEANILSREHFVVWSPALGGPLCPGVLEVVLNLIGSFGQLLSASEYFLGIILIEWAHFAFYFGAFIASRSSW